MYKVICSIYRINDPGRIVCQINLFSRSRRLLTNETVGGTKKLGTAG